MITNSTEKDGESHPFFIFAKNSLMDKYKEPLEDITYEGEEVRLCKDGRYRWKYKVNMFTNPAILITVFKVFFFTIVGLFVVFGFFLYVIHGDWEGLWWMTKGMLIALGGFFVLSLLGYLFVALIYHGKYIVLFEMDENEVVHIQVPEQFQKAQRIGIITAFAGLLTRRPGVAGAGLMSASRSSSTSVFAYVRKVKRRRWMHLIKVNQLLDRNQVYVRKEDYDFVYDFIKSHCPKVK